MTGRLENTPVKDLPWNAPVRNRLVVMAAAMVAYIASLITLFLIWPGMGDVWAGVAMVVSVAALFIFMKAAGSILKLILAKDRRSAWTMLSLSDGVTWRKAQFARAVEAYKIHFDRLRAAAMNGTQPDMIEIYRPNGTGWMLESEIAFGSYPMVRACLRYEKSEDGALKSLNLHYWPLQGATPSFVELRDPAYVREESISSREPIYAYRGETKDTNGERAVRLWKLHRSP